MTKTLLPLAILVCVAGCCEPRPIEPGTITYIRVEQSENPAGPGTLVISPGKTEATVEATYKPPDAPKPPTPAAKALGGLVWMGGALVVLGLLGLALRFIPWTATVGKVVPIGLSIVVALSGGLLIALATVLSSTPWWVVGLCVLGVVVVGVIVAARDNWKLLKR